MTQAMEELTHILPDTAEVNRDGHLTIGSCDMVNLASEFGTPLYLFDEATLRNRCREFRKEFSERYPDTLVIYACKAFINRTLAQIFKEEGLGLDVVSGGEIHIAKSVDFPVEKLYFHGNNKTQSELEQALDCGIGRIVVDNFYELSVLNDIAQNLGLTQDILLRISPGVDPHTHAYTATGVIDSKFGFPIITGQAGGAVSRAISSPNLNLVGLHFHLGSPIFEVKPYQQAIEIVLHFAVEMKDKHGFELREFSPGGGFAIPYTREETCLSVVEYADAMSSALHNSAEELGLPKPRLVVEPGRSVVGRAGVALYTTGAVKEIPGVRKYISLDGGIGDNIRPALYGSSYDTVVANKMGKEPIEQVTLAGKFCESGDILIKGIKLPQIESGDVIAIPVSGAYCLPMASNYNLSLKPSVVLVNNGEAFLVQRRETYEYIMERDILKCGK